MFEATAGDTQSQIFPPARPDRHPPVVGPMRDAMVVLLRRDLRLFTREAQRYLQDIYDHMIRIVEAETTVDGPPGEPAWPSSTGSARSPATWAPTPPSSPWSP